MRLLSEGCVGVFGIYIRRKLRLQTYHLQLDPTAQGYVARMLELASLRSWYEAGLREPWRDAAHEQEITQHGQVIQDLRAPYVAPQAP